jgi:hypothetical protein
MRYGALSMLQICSEPTWQKDLAGMPPLPQQNARLMETMEEIRVTRDRTLEIRFRERPPGA